MNNDDLLSQITTSLSSAGDTGPTVSDKLSKLVNDKFQTEYTVEKQKEILQKYQLIAMNCLCLKLTQRFGPNLMLALRGLTAENQRYRTL